MTNASKATAMGAASKPMHAELQHARLRQRRQHGLLALSLMMGAIFIIGLITFSNGTRTEIQPEAASETAMLHVSSPLGFSMGNTAYALYGPPTIAVSATGYKTLSKTLQTSETGGTVEVTLSEQPQTLQLRTKPSSTKTRWFIDDKLIKVAAQLQYDLLSGPHSISIDNPYYQKQNVNIEMKLGKGLQRSIDLEPIHGQLNIATRPSGATISMDGQTVGVSPLLLSKTGGLYSIEIKHHDFQTIRERIAITNTNSTITRNYRLAALPAYLTLQLSPVGGILLLNGKHISTAKKRLSIQAHTTHTLNYSKAGYFSQQQSISLASGAEKKLNFHLKAETGQLDIRSEPAANIIIDGKDMGQTPQLLTLSALPHRIELRRKGYRSYRKNIRPSNKTTQRIRAQLHSEAQARLLDAAPRLTNSAGIPLKLFKPNSTFVMGAPRYEKGQRANEFLRTIKLTRAFYISTHEISHAQYSQFKKMPGAANEPVTSISWLEAAAYCNWLSKRENLAPFYIIRDGQYRGFKPSALGYRLPSEAEWEWLARKSAKNKQSKFSWGDATIIPAQAGNIADEYAKGITSRYVPNYSDGYASIAPIGSYPAEKTGMFDLTGNVSEWVHDVYTLTPTQEQSIETDPLGAASGNTHTIKGSNWRSGSITELRASYRDGATTGRDDIGFRIARYIN